MIAASKEGRLSESVERWLVLREKSIMVNMNSITEEMKKELAFTEEELKELEMARKMPIIFDEECPEIGPEQAIKFRRANSCALTNWGKVYKGT